jgi:cytidylate kinase
MRDLQRSIAGSRDLVVAEGRDMGSVVFSESRCKFYLDASVDERARRRYAEIKAKGKDVDLARLREDIIARDRTDLERADSPLVRDAAAHYLDTTGMTIDEVVAELDKQVRRCISLEYRL